MVSRNKRYQNPLADKLELTGDDLKREAKLIRLCQDLQSKILTPIEAPFQWRFFEGDIAGPDAPPEGWRDWPLFDRRTVWGRPQSHTWLAAEVVVPEAARGAELLLQFSSAWEPRQGSTDPQCLAWLDGEIVQAIDGNHRELLIARDAVPGVRRVLHLNAFTFFDRPLTGFEVQFLLRDARAERLYYDLFTPLEVAIRLHQNDRRRHEIMDVVEQSLRALDRRAGQEAGFQASLPKAEAIAARIYQITDTSAAPSITAVGHTHLDTAWRWRVLHTRDKTARTFATTLGLMADHPNFVFMYNQGVLFDFLRDDYPALWARVMDRVKAGQFEIDGAMWVEPDANIVSGESLVRQIMRGRQFHLDTFGITPTCVWLPDTFGYSANLPQIMAGCGLDYFVTSKLSWNDTNRHPYDSFFWRGIDGSEVKAQLITTQAYEETDHRTIYNSDLSVSDVMGTWRRYEPKALSGETMMPYGYGDGGGGPSREMIARAQRMQRGIPGCPKLRMEGLRPFLERLGTRMEADRDRFPVWHGELYLQYHRGTLTSVARNKAANRQGEQQLRLLEFAAAMATVLAGASYPREAIARMWDVVLINQFHDILPGTSIAEVYADSDAEYDALFAEMGSENGPLSVALAATNAGGMRLFNPTGQARGGELVAVGWDAALEGKALVSGDSAVVLQTVTDAVGEKVLMAPADVPPMGWVSAGIGEPGGDAVSELQVSETRLENAQVAVEFDANGEINSIRDKIAGREVLAAGQVANRLVAYEDKPWTYDAWDIEAYFDEQSWPLADDPAMVEVIETGPHQAALRIERQFARSRIVQVVSLAAGARQVEFDTWLDWQERQTVLKACFPFDLNVSDIRSEIQFGHVTRATHRNTDRDRAQHEASMHRWVDMSEPDFGMALLNTCKYGYDAVDQMVRLTLVRGSVDPDPDADLGQHRFRYALMVHEGLRDLGAVHRAAERFNAPVLAQGRPGARGADVAFSFARADSGDVTLETVKLAEAGDAVILRGYEHANARCDLRIAFGVPVKAVRRCNLLEACGEALEVVDNGVALSLRPFEIFTLAIEPEG